MKPNPSRAEKLQKIYGQPSLPRKVRAGEDPGITNSVFFFFVKGADYQTRIGAGPLDPNEPYKITATGNMFNLGTPAVEMSFSKDGALKLFKERAIFHDSQQENLLVPSNLKYNQDIAEKVADRIITDILERSGPIYARSR